MTKSQKQTKLQLHEALEREQNGFESYESSSENSHSKRKKFLPVEPQTPQERAQYEKAVFTWIAPEYIQHPKSKMWYVGAAIVAGLFLAYDIFTGNLTMAFAILVLAGVYMYLHMNHPPKHIKITVSRMGIKVGNMIFPYNSIKAFWFHYSPPHITTLNLRVKEHFFSDIIIQLHNEDPAPLREYLCGQIPEWEGKNEKFSDVLLRLLKL